MPGQFMQAAILSQSQLSVVALPPCAEEVAHIVGQGADTMTTMDTPQGCGGSNRLLAATW